MSYKTVEKRWQTEIIEKKSRFIGYCTPVNDVDEAVDFINEIKAKHKDATHNVYAYIAGINEKYSDDGEPSGTAGVPVLDMLKKEGLTGVAVVVTRYFGGTLLGAGGLVRAYSQAARNVVYEAGIINKIYCSKYEVTCDYNQLGKIQFEIKKCNAVVINTVFGSRIKIEFYVKKENEKKLVSNLTDISNATAIIEYLGEDLYKEF